MNRKCRSLVCAGRLQGSALMVVLILAFVVSLVVGIAITAAMQQGFAIGRTGDQVRAKVLSEAGANRAYSLLATNFGARTNAALFPETALGGGFHDANVVTVSSVQAVIYCTGTYRNAKARTVVDVMNHPQPFGDETELPPENPWGYTVLCNGYVRHNGGGDFFGKAHVNSYMDCNGSFEWGSATSLVQVAVCSAAKGLKVSGNATVHGTVSAPVISVTGQKTIDIENIGPVTAVTFPTVENGMVDWTPFYNIAVANNQVFGSQTINGNANWAIPGGVRWINGDLRVNGGGNLTYSGCVIATGSIRINGGMTHTRLANLPALVSRDSTITMNGAHSIGGLVYAKGDITWNGSGTFTGSILCGGNMTFNGTYGILGYSYCEPNPNLNLTSNQVDRVVVEAWQD